MSIDYSKWPLLVEACMEWIAQRWTKSMIRAELRDWFKDDINATVCQAIIKAAKDEIKRKYNIDASEYRGRQISFYELIIREKKYYKEFIKVQERIKAAERLDKLFNLEGIQAEDADAIAERVRAALQEMDENQFSEVPEDARSEFEGLRKTYNDAQRTGAIKTKNESGNGESKNEPKDDEPKNEPKDGKQKAASEDVSQDKSTQETVDDAKAESVPNGREAEADNNSMDIEETATFDNLSKEIRNLITNPDNNKKFEEFAKRKTKRKELDN